MKTINKSLYITAVIFASIFFISSNNYQRNKVNDELYIFLKYDSYDVDSNTYYLVVSDVLKYDDWKNKRIELSDNFKVRALEYLDNVWAPSVKEEGLSNSIDEVMIKRSDFTNSFNNYHSRNSTVKVYYIYL